MSPISRSLARPAWLFAVAVFVLAACGDSAGPQAGPSFVITGAGSRTDTASAQIPEPLRVEVHDSSGAVVRVGTAVRFSAIYQGLPPNATPELLVQPLTSATYVGFAVVPTDPSGAASVRVALGTLTGTARLLVAVASLGLEDTVRFTVTPGNAAH